MDGHNFDDDFRWSQLDHKSIEEQLQTLRSTIESEIRAGEHLSPIPDRPTYQSFKTPRQAHSFEVLQQERADEWTARAYKIYCDNWEMKGGRRTQQFVYAVWCNAIYHFINDDVLNCLRLAFCIDERAKKLLGREYGGMPQAAEAHSRVSAVNRIYQNIIKVWQEKRIPKEATALKALLATPNRPGSLQQDVLKVSDLEPAPSPSVAHSAYDRSRERDLKLKISHAPGDESLKEELLKELIEQQRVAQTLTGLQGQNLAISVFGRTDVQINQEIGELNIELGRGKTIPPESSAAALSLTNTPIFTHSENYESITFGGKSYSLHERQAAVIRLLHEAIKKGHAPVSKKKLLSVSGCETVDSIRDIFKSRPELWGKLIVNCEDTGEGRGFYRLNPSITE